MVEKEMQSADVCTHKDKIKTSFAKIFVSGTPDRPYFNILYFDPADQDYHIGFSSYCLEYVFKWISEEFEIEDAPAADVVPVVRCKDCEYSYDEISYLCCSHGVCVDCEVPPNFYCAYGKRRSENEPPEEGET